MILFYVAVGIFAIVGFVAIASLLYIRFSRMNIKGGQAISKEEIKYVLEEDRKYKDELKVFFDSLSEDQVKIMPEELKGQIDYALRKREEYLKENTEQEDKE
tara:strand:- start:1102 stop:1407 length:306 start_codon:yes stop_codon:yes gene_type:complete